MKLQATVNGQVVTFADGTGETLFEQAEIWFMENQTYSHLTIITDPLLENKVTINICMGLSKSRNQISWLSKQPFRVTTRSKTNVIASYCCDSISYDPTSKILAIKLTSYQQVSRPYQASCGMIRRMVNLIEWCAKLELRLKSQKLFTQDTFEAITVHKRLKKIQAQTIPDYE